MSDELMLCLQVASIKGYKDEAGLAEAYVKELEAELAEYKHIASAIDKQWAESQDEIADLKAKLAKAVGALEGLMMHEPDYADTVWQEARTTLAELKGETNE